MGMMWLTEIHWVHLFHLFCFGVVKSPVNENELTVGGTVDGGSRGRRDAGSHDGRPGGFLARRSERLESG